MAPFLLMVAAFGIFLALAFNESEASVLPTMLAHLSLNITLAIGGVSFSALAFWWTLAGAYGVVAAIAIIRLRPKKSQSEGVVAASRARSSV
jgi:hypothetical protein